MIIVTFFSGYKVDKFKHLRWGLGTCTALFDQVTFYIQKGSNTLLFESLEKKNITPSDLFDIFASVQNPLCSLNKLFLVLEFYDCTR